MLTTDQKGVLAEQAIAFEALKLGVGVFRPLGDERYDLILDLRPQLIRVQCKWAVQHGGVVVIGRAVADGPAKGSFIGLRSRRDRRGSRVLPRPRPLLLVAARDVGRACSRAIAAPSVSKQPGDRRPLGSDYEPELHW
jgi:hypothetical protein